MGKLLGVAAILERFTSVAANRKGMCCILAVAAILEVAGDSCVNKGTFNASGMARTWWLIGGFVVLCLYSLFLNFSNIPFGKVLGLYVLFFATASQGKACYDDHKWPSLIMFLGLCFIAVGSWILTSQVE